jgi:hypothetical protein
VFDLAALSPDIGALIETQATTIARRDAELARLRRMQFSATNDPMRRRPQCSLAPDEIRSGDRI